MRQNGEFGQLLTRVAAERPLPLNEDAVAYVSSGVVLCIGPAEQIVTVARQLAPSLRVIACSADPLPSSSARANPLFIPCCVTALSGYLGQFRPNAEDLAGRPFELAAFSPKADGSFDLVLDLSPQTLISAEIKPPGYFAPDGENIDAAITQLVALQGSFRKPRFVRYDAGLCTHGAQGVQGCDRCLAHCPAQAIVSHGGRVAVDPYLCQGCSTCTLVCPTGALTHAVYPPQALLATIARMPEQGGRLRIEAAGESPANTPDEDTDPATLRITAIAAAGAEIWFSALTRGFAQVLIELPGELPPSTREAFAAQLAQARELLAALGHPVARITADAGDALPLMRSVRAVAVPPYAGKRAQILWALTTLAEPETVRVVRLAAGAEYGSVNVETQRCTLCMACSQLCPTAALLATGADTRLEFIESACVQCGLCQRACPERAITLQPRLRLGATLTPVVLSENQRHRCPQCGIPFISAALLAKGIDIMRRQEEVDDAAIERLRLCPGCRVQAIGQPLLAARS